MSKKERRKYNSLSLSLHLYVIASENEYIRRKKREKSLLNDGPARQSASKGNKEVLTLLWTKKKKRVGFNGRQRWAKAQLGFLEVLDMILIAIGSKRKEESWVFYLIFFFFSHWKIALASATARLLIQFNSSPLLVRRHRVICWQTVVSTRNV